MSINVHLLLLRTEYTSLNDRGVWAQSVLPLPHNIATTQPTTPNNLKQLLLGGIIIGNKTKTTPHHTTMWLHLKHFKATQEADFRYATLF